MPIAPPEPPVLSNKKTQKAAVLPAALTECLKMRWNLIIQQKYSFVNPLRHFFEVTFTNSEQARDNVI